MKQIIRDWKRPKEEFESVVIELPYYWKEAATSDDLSGNGVYYGRMNKDSSRDVIVVIDGLEKKLEFKVQRIRPLADNGFWDGFHDLRIRGCESTKAEFEGALAKLNDAIKDVEERR